MESTFVMVKPDGVQRGLVGEVISRFEEKGLRIIALKMLKISGETAAEHYAEHEGKDFYEPLLDYITSGPVVAMAVKGDSVVSMVRKIVGKTDPKEADPGTIRGDFGIDVSRNIIHAADSDSSAERELGIFFDEEDYQDYKRVDESWIYP
ncbi:MAG: nucleoside-diphosphate kinase [Thermoplasmatota archaeon]